MNALLQRLKSKTYWVAIVGALLTAVELNSGLPWSIHTYAISQLRHPAVACPDGHIAGSNHICFVG